MESFPEWADAYYGLYLSPYLPASEQARERVDRFLPRLIRHLPKKGSRVLDLCCGAGAYLFPLEKAGYTMTGLDIQERMLGAARKHASKIGSMARLVKGDATRLKFKEGAFDAIVFMGSATTHFSMGQMEKIMAGAHRALRPRGVMVTEANDHVAMFFSGMYQRTLYEPAENKDIISIHARYDSDKGTFNRLFLNLENNRRFKGSFQIWAPWILNHMMEKAGFRLKTSEQGSFGFFSKIFVHAKR
jgi:ubiquinone/menaquinone biosynthesis C-methylase UbiE